MQDMEGEGSPKKKKGIKSSVSYARNASITTTGHITIRNITAIM